MDTIRIGDILVGVIISIDNYAYKALRDFNIYEANQSALEAKRALAEFLLDGYVEAGSITRAELDVFQMDALRVDRRFVSSQLPTVEQMLEIEKLLPQGLGLIPRTSMERLATHLDMCPENCEFTIRELLERNIDNCTTNRAMLSEMVLYAGGDVCFLNYRLI